MASVTFSTTVGGDGSTVTDDSNPATGLDGGGHRTRFVPCLAQTVAVASYTKGRAEAAAASATSAATSATSATSSKNAAAASATEAANSATAAAGSASSAAATVAGAIAAAFPVGAIYITAGNTNPGTFLGGTWAQIAQGRTLIGVGTLGSDTYAAGATGGAARVTLTTTEMPSHGHGGATGTQSENHTHSGTTESAGAHTHTYKKFNGWTNGGGGSTNTTIDGNGAATYFADTATTADGAHTHTFTTGSNSASHAHGIAAEGSGGAHENRMPYLAVYFWQRTA